MTRTPHTLATPTMFQLRAAFTAACSWLLGTPARLIGRLVAWRLAWGAMGDLRARGRRRTIAREVCRCGHSRHLHYSNRYACGLRYNWSRVPARLDTYRARTDSCPCVRYRPARWTDEHSLWRHLTVRLWWALSDDQRYALCRLYDRITRGRRCWCDIIDAALQATPDRRADYRGPLSCACDAPLPWDAGKPIPGRCYCPPWRTER